MPVRAGSRFENAPVLRDEHGKPYYGRIIPETQTTEYVEYYTVDGDRIEALADKYLNEPTLWWKIALVNPEIDEFEDLPPNTRLRIPRARSTS